MEPHRRSTDLTGLHFLLWFGWHGHFGAALLRVNLMPRGAAGN